MVQLSFKREFSAGGVVFKRLASSHKRPGFFWLIGKHSGYHKWVLPKGLIEEGERGFETAVREVEEEMGVKARLVSEKPVHRVQYVYWAEFKQEPGAMVDISHYAQSDEGRARRSSTIRSLTSRVPDGTRRRVEKYQEGGGKKTKVFKVVSFYLMEYVSGNPKDHDWEMEEAGWFSSAAAMKKLVFEGERDAMQKAHDKLLKSQS